MNFDTLESTKDRLDNWYKCFRNSPNYRVTASLEGRYVSPQAWHAVEAKTIINTIDALEVERAVIGLPELYKAILKYIYFQKHINLKAFCRKHKVREDQFTLEEAKAIRMVDNRIRK